MGYKRFITISFWTDKKVYENLNTEQKLLFLYFITSPHSNIAGCYEVSLRTVENETGIRRSNLLKDISVLEENDLIRYDRDTNNVLIMNYHKYNWSNSPDLLKGVVGTLKYVQNEEYIKYIKSLLDGKKASPVPSDGTDNRPSDDGLTPSDDSLETYIQINNQISVSDSNSVSSSNNSDSVKKKYGQYQNVLLTDKDLDQLKEEYPDDWEKRINDLDKGIELHGYDYQNHYLAIKSWDERAKEKAKAENKKTDYGEEGAHMWE